MQRRVFYVISLFPISLIDGTLKRETELKEALKEYGNLSAEMSPYLK
ncbi:hypothetical protein [Lactococcus lactis]